MFILKRREQPPFAAALGWRLCFEGGDRPLDAAELRIGANDEFHGFLLWIGG